MIKKLLPKIVLVVAVIAIISVIFEKCNSNVEHKAFLQQVDSLHKVNDSLFAEIKKDDNTIDSLNQVDSDLQWKLAHQKAKVITIDHWVD